MAIPTPQPENPFKVIAASIKAVPFVKYALGIAGIIAILILIKAWAVNLRVAAWGTVIMLVLMTVLFLLAKGSQSKNKRLVGPFLLLIWGIVLIFILAIAAIFLSIFFRWPINLTHWINPPIPIADVRPTIDTLPNVNKDEPKKIENDRDPFKKKEKKIASVVTISFQLESKSQGYSSILFNENPLIPNAESTQFNPRIQIEVAKLPGVIKIITKKGDTCISNVDPSIENAEIYRVFPDCP